MIVIDGFVYDASIKEEHERKSETTKFPVESGGDGSDNVRLLNNIIQITGVVSDTPMGEVEAIRNLDFGSSDKPSEEAKARLIALQAARRSTTIVTAGGVYEDVVMTSFVEHKGAEFTGGLFFDCTFEQRRVVTNERTTVQVAVPRAAKRTDKGPRPTRPSNIVDRKVNCDTPRAGCAWFDPDVQAWRMTARYDADAGHYIYVKGPLESDGFVGTDAQIRKHLHDSDPTTGSGREGGFTVIKSMDPKAVPNQTVVVNPGTKLVLDPTQAEWAAADAGQPLPPPPNTVPESLRP